MGKPKNHELNITVQTKHNYGTRSEDIIKKSDVLMSVFGPKYFNDFVCVAVDHEDNDTLYVTNSSAIDDMLLDANKCYNKKLFVISELPSENDQRMFKIERDGVSITI